MTKLVKFINVKLFWIALLMLPIITYSITYIRATETPPTFKTFIENQYELTAVTGITDELYNNQSVKDMLNSINISENTFKTIGYMMNYMILIEMIHLITDVILMLPRLIQKGFKKIGLGEE